MLRQVLLGTAAVCAAVASGIGATSAAELKVYNNVTQQRLDNPEPSNWLMYRGNYQGWGYSPLEQINAGNVKQLEPVWSLSTGMPRRAPVAAHRQRRGHVRHARRRPR